MYSDEEETVYERHYIDEEKTRKNLVKRSAVIKSELLNDIITLYDGVPEVGTPLPKQETPWDMTTKERKRAKLQAILCGIVAGIAMLVVIAMILQSKAGI